MNKRLKNCPVCNSTLEIRTYQCPSCETKIEGKFSAGDFDLLNAVQQEFAKVFICSQGNIKEVEKKLKISYPTVKKQLQEISNILCNDQQSKQNDKRNYLSILEEIENGKVSVSEAIKQIKK